MALDLKNSRIRKPPEAEVVGERISTLLLNSARPHALTF